LNYYVNVDTISKNKKLSKYVEEEKNDKLKDYSIFILTGNDIDENIALSKYCHTNGIKLIIA